MKIIAIEKEVPGVNDNAFAPFLKDEASVLWELFRKGIVRESYFTKDTHEAVLILECNDETEAKNILDTLPLVRERLIKFKIHALLPYDGYERLFKQ